MKIFSVICLSVILLPNFTSSQITEIEPCLNSSSLYCGQCKTLRIIRESQTSSGVKIYCEVCAPGTTKKNKYDTATVNDDVVDLYRLCEASPYNFPFKILQWKNGELTTLAIVLFIVIPAVFVILFSSGGVALLSDGWERGGLWELEK